MSFSSRRRNYLLTPHRRDGLVEFMKSMLTHSFVLDALKTTGADTFEHFEHLIDEHREIFGNGTKDFSCQMDALNLSPTSISTSTNTKVSRLQMLVPTVKTFFTRLPLRMAFIAYDAKYSVTARKHICISFNEIRHILNLAQIMAMCPGITQDEVLAVVSGETLEMNDISNEDVGGASDEETEYMNALESKKDRKLSMDSTFHFMDCENRFRGPKMITFDADQTLYSDGANFDSNPKLANYIYLLLTNNVICCVVTAAGYEYQTEKYEMRMTGLLNFFKQKGLRPENCSNFFIFGGECNYLMQLNSGYRLNPVKETGPGGWVTATRFLGDSPANWSDEAVAMLLDASEEVFNTSVDDQKLRARVIRKKRSIGLIPQSAELISREALDETVLRAHDVLNDANVSIPYCAFNGGSDAWVDCGNKRVGVQILQAYLDIPADETLHIGDQFLNTGNDYAARDSCPCLWITKPEETTYILKLILRMAGVEQLEYIATVPEEAPLDEPRKKGSSVNFNDAARRSSTSSLTMDVYTGEIVKTLNKHQLASKASFNTRDKQMSLPISIHEGGNQLNSE